MVENFIMLTKYSGSIPIISPVFSVLVNIMGVIMDAIFKVTSAVGIENIGLCIILFTIVTRILMFPLSYNQGKSQKMMSSIQPEIKAIQSKYAGKTDQNSMMMQQAEMKAVYEKYGISMTGGCGQLLIQMPIIFALYRVILNIPAYVASVKVPFENIVNAIGGADAISKVNEFAQSTEELSKIVTQARISDGIIQTTDNIIDFLYLLNPSQWDLFKDFFSSAGTVIAENYDKIEQMNNFLGINLATSPSAYGLLSIKAWIIPVLAGLSQFAATKLMSSQTKQMSSGNDVTAQTMQTMNMMMPLMSVVFCFSFASGIGVYWIASSVLMGVQQYFLNKHFEKMDINELVKANIEKANAKRAKKGLPPINEKAAEENYRKMQEKMARMENQKDQKVQSTHAAIEKSNEYYELTSIADRAKMVQQFNDKKKYKNGRPKKKKEEIPALTDAAANTAEAVEETKVNTGTIEEAAKKAVDSVEEKVASAVNAGEELNRQIVKTENDIADKVEKAAKNIETEAKEAAAAVSEAVDEITGEAK